MTALGSWDGRFGLAFAAVASVLATSLGGCTQGGVVGGTCRAGYVVCDGHCVDLATDAKSCGACGRVCAAGSTCEEGVCGGPFGHAGAGGSPGTAGSDAGGAGAQSYGGHRNEGGYNGRGGAGGSAGGAGGSAGGAGGSAGGSAGGASGGGVAGQGGAGTPLVCDAPLVNCNGACVDLNVDPTNCGGCDRVCASGLCQGGVCVGATVGHIVIACMDFTQAVSISPQATILGNAVFIPLKSPVRILSYAQYVDSKARTHVDDTIAASAQLRGRTYRIDAVTTELDVRTKLNILDYDALLVYDQPNAPAGELAQTGALWANTLDSFVRSGGVVVALDGGDAHSETRTLVQNAGLFDSSGTTNATYGTLYNRAPADGVGLNVISPYFALRNTCTFQTSVTPDVGTVFVVTDSSPSAGLGNPVVVHQIRAP